MISTTRQWFRRNRTTFAVGGAVLGAGYLATQYVLGKLTETRQRMSDERIAKEKYVDRYHMHGPGLTIDLVFVAASNRTRRTAPSQSLLFFPRP
jgi:peroxin-3